MTARPSRLPATFRASSSATRPRVQPAPRTPRVSAASRGRVTTAEWLGFPLGVGVLHIVAVQLIASLAYHFGNLREDSAPWDPWVPPDLGGWAGTLVEPLRLWDGLWYKLIAEEGYGEHVNTYPAFWPLFPWLMRLGSDVFGVATETAGWHRERQLSGRRRPPLSPRRPRLRPAHRPPHDHRPGGLPDVALLFRRLYGVSLSPPGRRGAVRRPARIVVHSRGTGAARGPHPLPGCLSPPAVRGLALAAVWGSDQVAPTVAEHPAHPDLCRVAGIGANHLRAPSGQPRHQCPKSPGQHQSRV